MNGQTSPVFFHSPWRRLLVASLSALVILGAIFIFATEFLTPEDKQYQNLVFDGHHYFPESGHSVEEFLSQNASGESNNRAPRGHISTTRGEHWVWFTADKIDEAFTLIQLELAWLDQVAIYFLSLDGQYKTFEAGDEQVFKQRIISFRKPVFPLLREVDGSQVEKIVMRVSAQGRFTLPLVALSEKAFNRQANQDYLFYGAWIAILMTLGFYSASIFLSLRYEIHFFYLLYVMVFGGLLITASGIGQQYLWPGSENLTTLIANIFLALTNYGTALFVIHFVRLGEYSNLLSKMIRALAYVSLACIPLVVVYGYSALPPILLSSFAIMGLIILAALYTSLKGNELAPFLFASLMILLPCNTVGLFRFLGLFEAQPWTEHIAELGLVADALILSSALAFMVNRLRREKDSVSLIMEQERVAFAKQLFNAKEQERKAIGQALHDGLGHKILSIKTALNSLPAGGSDQVKRDSLQMLDGAIEDVRDLSHLLYPSIIDHIGLEKAIENVVRNMQYANNIEYNTRIPELQVSTESGLLLYRAAQEFVNNVLKHSDASRFTLEIETLEDAGEIILRATDNGNRRFSAADFGFGLNMLKQQAKLFGGDLGINITEFGTNVLTLRIFDKNLRNL